MNKLLDTGLLMFGSKGELNVAVNGLEAGRTCDRYCNAGCSVSRTY